MKTKAKPCKGIGKAKSVKGCGKITPYRKYGLCSSCLTAFYRGTDAGKLLVLKAYQKASKPRKEFEKAQAKRKDENDIKRLKKLAEKWVHKYVRARDKDLPCISENIRTNNKDAGHYYSKNKFEGLRFDYDNIHGQSINGNRFKEGNVEAYRINLISRIGKERVDELDKKAAYWKVNPKRWEVDELKLIISDAQNRYKELK